MVEAIFDLIPVGLAIVAIVLLSRRFDHVRRTRDKISIFISVISASLLIVAQLSWWSASFLKNESFDLSFANVLWTLFNSLTMIVFIIWALPRREIPNS